MMLKRHKHTVSIATNGAEAVKMVCERMESLDKPFDVILMDLQMPVMDGLEATRRLRGMEATGCWSLKQSSKSHYSSGVVDPAAQHCVIIGVSANSDVETAKAAYAVGVDNFITKPFSVDVLYSCCQQIAEKSCK